MIKMEPEKDIFEEWTGKYRNRPWYKKILDWLVDIPREIRRFYRDVKNGISNLIKWFPIIWKDRNWDHRYIFDILKFKLEQQSKWISERGIHVSAQRDAEKMMTCVRLIDKVNDEYYAIEYMDYSKDKHWFVPSETPGYSEIVSKETYNNLQEYFEKYPLIYKRVLKGEGIYKNNDDKSIALSIGYMNHNRARKLLFRILEENIECWWD